MSYRYSTDPLDDDLGGLDGLGGYGGAGNLYNDNFGLGAYDTGLTALGGDGLDSYGSGLGGDPLSAGLGGLSLDRGLDGLGTGIGGSALDGLGGGYDSEYSGLGSGLSGDFGIPIAGGDFLGQLPLFVNHVQQTGHSSDAVLAQILLL